MLPGLGCTKTAAQMSACEAGVCEPGGVAVQMRRAGLFVSTGAARTINAFLKGNARGLCLLLTVEAGGRGGRSGRAVAAFAFEDQTGQGVNLSGPKEIGPRGPSATALHRPSVNHLQPNAKKRRPPRKNKKSVSKAQHTQWASLARPWRGKQHGFASSHRVRHASGTQNNTRQTDKQGGGEREEEPQTGATIFIAHYQQAQSL